MGSLDIFRAVQEVLEQKEAHDIQDRALTADSERAIEAATPLLSAKRDDDLAEALGITDIDETIHASDAAIADAQTEAQQLAAFAGGLKPREYQNIGIEWLRTKRRAMLTDQAGLGKTLQAILAAEAPVLVIAPTYLTEQWYDAVCAQFPKLAEQNQIVLAKGSRMSRIKALKARARWTIINIQMLRTFHMYIDPTHFATIIIDEAHHIRNRQAKQSKLAAKLCKGINKRVFLLTATPIWKNPDDLWMQLHVLQPKLFPSYNEFVELFCNTTEDPWQGIKVVGIKRHMRKELQMLLDIVRLGRTYKDVGRVLPEVIHRFIKVEFPKELGKKYHDLKKYWMLQLEGIEDNSILFSSYAAVLHSLRALTAFDEKYAALVEALRDEMAGTKPAAGVVFCWYKDHAYAIARVLKAAGFDGVEVITGDVPASERKTRAMRAKIAVATISSMSEGVNLYHARHVHYFEENWVPGSNYQSLSRVRRDRNDDGADLEPVRVYYYHVKGTIDERIHGMSKAREGTIKDLIKESLN